jgi:inner membrane transporter RhtA
MVLIYWVLYLHLAGALWAAYIVLGGKVSKIMKGGEASHWNVVCRFINIAFGILGNGFQQLTLTTSI